METLTALVAALLGAAARADHGRGVPGRMAVGGVIARCRRWVCCRWPERWPWRCGGAESGHATGSAESVLLAGTGLLACGVVPLLVFRPRAGCSRPRPAGSAGDGADRPELRSIDSAVCVVGAQSSYLGEGTVAEAFAAGVLCGQGWLCWRCSGCRGGGAVDGGVGAAGPPPGAPLASSRVLAAAAGGGGADDGRPGRARRRTCGSARRPERCSGCRRCCLVGAPGWAVVHRREPAPRRGAYRGVPVASPGAARSRGPTGGPAAASTATRDGRRGWVQRTAWRSGSPPAPRSRR